MIEVTPSHNCNSHGCPICDPWRDTKALEETRAENAALKDLLARILSSMEDGTAWIPDVSHAMEATIKDALKGEAESA